MGFLELEVARSRSSELVVQTLPDGSTAIFEVATKNVYSLNPSAAAAFAACDSAMTLSELAAAMSRRLDTPVTEEVAHEAASELAAVGLVTITPPEGLGTSRRDLLKQVAGVALPAVLVLTGVEQRAYAQGAGSPPVVTTSPGGGTTTSPPLTTTASICTTNTFGILKGVQVAPGNVTPLPGAVFEVRTAGSNQLVATLTTDATGWASVSPINPGNYRLIEISAPGGPYEPIEPINFTIDPSCNDLWFDLRNIPLTTTAP